MNCVFFLLFIVSFLSFLILSYLIFCQYFCFICLVYSIRPCLSFLVSLIFWRHPWKIVTAVWFGVSVCYRYVHLFEYQYYQPLDLFSRKWHCQTLSIPSATVLVCVFRCTATWRVCLHCDSQVWPCLTWTKKYIPKHPDESLMAFRCFASSESGSSSSPANRPRATISMRMFPSSNNLSALYASICA